MDISSRSTWHVYGTRAPSGRERGGPPSEIRPRYATGLVPQRATGGAVSGAKAQVTGESWGSVTSNGTQWHGGPRESARGHGRTR